MAGKKKINSPDCRDEIKQCLVGTSDPIIAVGERRSSASFDNSFGHQFELYDNDRCVMPPELPKADYVLYRNGVGELIIELKGRGVERAIKQVESTFEYWRANGYFKGPSQAALILCTNVPKAAAAQRAQSRLQARIGRPVRAITHCRERRFESFFLVAKVGV